MRTARVISMPRLEATAASEFWAFGIQEAGSSLVCHLLGLQHMSILTLDHKALLP